MRVMRRVFRTKSVKVKWFQVHPLSLSESREQNTMHSNSFSLLCVHVHVSLCWCCLFTCNFMRLLMIFWPQTAALSYEHWPCSIMNHMTTTVVFLSFLLCKMLFWIELEDSLRQEGNVLWQYWLKTVSETWSLCLDVITEQLTSYCYKLLLWWRGSWP